MPGNPKGSCLPCKVIKETVNGVSNNMKKHVMIYAFFYLLILELGSFIIRENVTEKEYDKFYFPMLVQFSFFVVFLNFYLFRNRLKFCKRKKFVVGGLTFYYFLNFITVLFPICNTTYVTGFSIVLLFIIQIILLQTIYSNYKK